MQLAKWPEIGRSGASCPDALVEAVIRKIAGYYSTPDQIEKMVAEI